MSTLDFKEMVLALKKPGKDIINSLTPEKADAWHMASCIGGEAGELFDAVKKWVVYEKDIDIDNVIEELGDLEFYLEGLRQILEISREITLEQNIVKLSTRYHKLKYSNEQAQNRADKQ